MLYHAWNFLKFFNVFKFYTWKKLKEFFFPVIFKNGKTIHPDLKKKILRREKKCVKISRKKISGEKTKRYLHVSDSDI